MNNCPVHDAVHLPDEPSDFIFFGMGGPEVVSTRDNSVCTCPKVHTPIITVLSTTPLKIDLQEDETNFK